MIITVYQINSEISKETFPTLAISLWFPPPIPVLLFDKVSVLFVLLLIFHVTTDCSAQNLLKSHLHLLHGLPLRE